MKKRLAGIRLVVKPGVPVKAMPVWFDRRGRQRWAPREACSADDAQDAVALVFEDIKAAGDWEE